MLQLVMRRVRIRSKMRVVDDGPIVISEDEDDQPTKDFVDGGREEAETFSTFCGNKLIGEISLMDLEAVCLDARIHKLAI